jgi:endoribonuclease LACTB2
MYISCSDHVFQMPLASPTLKPAVTTNTYLIKSQDQLLVVDPGFEYPDNTRKIMKAIEELDSPAIVGILLTHYHKDHSTGVVGLAGLYSCPIYCHEKEADQVDQMIHPFKHTNTLKDGENLRIGNLEVTVLHTPGHTPGHIALYVEQDAILLTGDTVINGGSTWIGPPDGHMKTYLQSLEKLKQIPISLIGPGHGSLIHEPQRALEWFLSRRLDRERQILSLLKQYKQVTVEQLVVEIYTSEVDPQIIRVAEKTVLAHLIKLVEEGVAQEIASKGDAESMRAFATQSK